MIQKKNAINCIPETRSLLFDHSITCIENVPSAPIRADLILTAPTVGVRGLERLRHFELSFAAKQPLLLHVAKADFASGRAITVSTGEAVSRRLLREQYGVPRPGRPEMIAAMEVQTGMTFDGVANAIPPAMAEYIGKEAIAFMRGERMYQQKLIS